MFSQRRKPKENGEIEKGRICCSILRDHEIPHMGADPSWGCSSVGRAPALQAGGHGFESHHLHQRRLGQRDGENDRERNGLIAQQARARA